MLRLEVGHLSDVRHDSRRARSLTSELIRAIRNAGSWLEDVLKRDLLFAVRCLCDTGKLSVDNDLRNSLMDELITLWRTTPYEPQRQEIEALFAYAMPTIDGERIYTELLRYLDDTTIREAAATALGQLGKGGDNVRSPGAPGGLDCRYGWGCAPGSGKGVGTAGCGGATTPEVLGRLVALIADTALGVCAGQRQRRWDSWAQVRQRPKS